MRMIDGWVRVGTRRRASGLSRTMAQMSRALATSSNMDSTSTRARGSRSAKGSTAHQIRELHLPTGRTMITMYLRFAMNVIRMNELLIPRASRIEWFFKFELTLRKSWSWRKTVRRASTGSCPMETASDPMASAVSQSTEFEIYIRNFYIHPFLDTYLSFYTDLVIYLNNNFMCFLSINNFILISQPRALFYCK